MSTLLRLATAGSVDDGKSTLVGRLLYDSKSVLSDQLDAVERVSAAKGLGHVDLALLTDGLRAEREQGITIDVAYRYFSTDRRKFIIADCPGHEQYTRNMATGASNCQLAIILIDARHGVMPQTRRHSYICSLLGIKHLVVAVNKMDLAGFSQAVFEDIRRAYTDFAAGRLDTGLIGREIDNLTARPDPARAAAEGLLALIDAAHGEDTPVEAVAGAVASPWDATDAFDLGPGDSFQFAGADYAWRNPGPERAVVIWVVAPPVY